MRRFLIILMVLGVIGSVSGCSLLRTDPQTPLSSHVRCVEAPEVPNLPPIDEDGLVRLDGGHRESLLIYFESVEWCFDK